MSKIPFGRPFIAGKELYYIAEAVLGGNLAGDSQFTKRCHLWIELRLGARRALLTHSCTAALEIAAILCDIQAGDEVIMPSYTFVSTANAFVLRGGVPVFIDIRPDTLNIDERLIEAAITERTRAIVPVHYAGVACDMDAIMAIARKHGLLVVEDAAQAMFSRYQEKSLGTIGHLGCLSFHETKNIISGEGGALLVNDERFIERSEIIREKGTNRSQFFRGAVDKYTWMDIGSSYLPSDLIGAFLFGQLEHAEMITAERMKLCKHYWESLAPLEQAGQLSLPAHSNVMQANGHLFYLLTRSLSERTALIEFLRGQEIHAVFHYVPLHSSPAGEKFGRACGEMAVTDSVSERIVRLPLYYGMTNAEQERVVAAIFGFYQPARLPGARAG